LKGKDISQFPSYRKTIEAKKYDNPDNIDLWKNWQKLVYNLLDHRLIF